MFKDRSDAGKKLADKLVNYKNTQTIVYALPRGGVVVGYEIAKKLNLPLDIIITRKIGHQSNPEYAICAIAEDGHKVCNQNEEQSADPKWLSERFKEEQKEASLRRKIYLKNRPMLSPKNKTAIIVDDGIATGLTIMLAIREIKHENPSKIIVAVPIAPADAVNKIKKEVDEVIAIEIDKDYLGAVGEYYEDFFQIEDDEVIKIMSKYNN
jgi:predicted phosphoribosyltransferase